MSRTDDSNEHDTNKNNLPRVYQNVVTSTTNTSSANPPQQQPITTTTITSGNLCVCANNTPRVPRPRNAFILYRQHQHALVVQEHPGKSNPEISKIIGEQWRSLPQKEKDFWIQLGDEEKKSHLERFPDYRYQPRRSSKRGGSTSGTSTPTGTGQIGEATICPNCKGLIINGPGYPNSNANNNNNVNVNALANATSNITTAVTVNPNKPLDFGNSAPGAGQTSGTATTPGPGVPQSSISSPAIPSPPLRPYQSAPGTQTPPLPYQQHPQQQQQQHPQQQQQHSQQHPQQQQQQPQSHVQHSSLPPQHSSSVPPPLHYDNKQYPYQPPHQSPHQLSHQPQHQPPHQTPHQPPHQPQHPSQSYYPYPPPPPPPSQTHVNTLTSLTQVVGSHRASAPQVPSAHQTILPNHQQQGGPRHQSAPEAFPLNPPPLYSSRSPTVSSSSLLTDTSSIATSHSSISSASSSSAPGSISSASGVSGNLLPRIVPRPQDEILGTLPGSIPKSPIARQLSAGSPFKPRSVSSPAPEGLHPPPEIHPRHSSLDRHASPSWNYPTQSASQSPIPSAATSPSLGSTVPNSSQGISSGTGSTFQLYNRRQTSSVGLRPSASSHSLSSMTHGPGSSIPHAGPVSLLAEEEKSAKRRRTSSHYDPLGPGPAATTNSGPPPSHYHHHVTSPHHGTSRLNQASAPPAPSPVETFGFREKADLLSTICEPLHHHHHHRSTSIVETDRKGRIIAVEGKDLELVEAITERLGARLEGSNCKYTPHLFEQKPYFMYTKSAVNMFKVSCLHQLVSELNLSHFKYGIIGGYLMTLADELADQESPLTAAEQTSHRLTYRHRWMTNVNVLRGLPGPDYLILIDQDNQADATSVSVTTLNGGSKIIVATLGNLRTNEVIDRAVDGMINGITGKE
ncbi:Rox1p [Sugiyamaella lignohabitans]|uniref:Rox1p n=1 Tax=Sugiyamaella lignohabitans TaxID=796027 RepID=A0A167EZS5_9ASCO|nr:Rox1p [Sugiyamaella lignohabitans]ANB14646.1 Rox1p [Sugiyamaella lignohabitans]